MVNNRMFSFITKTWNPVKATCPYDCKYCWAKQLIKKYNMTKYMVKEPQFIKTKTNFTDKDFIFVCDMIDLFAYNIPSIIIQKVIDVTYKYPDTNFLFLTKNPKRYTEFHFPPNCVLGATIESNIDYPKISKAPLQQNRLEAMKELTARFNVYDYMYDNAIFISIEPILNFTSDFIKKLLSFQLKGQFAVAVGYDNYNNNLPEPPLEKTRCLIEILKNNDIKVYEKTIRKAWYEK